MAFHAIAYGPDELSLLTIDARELLAHDAATERPTWRHTFDRPLVAATFAAPHALPRSSGANPWRTHSTARAVVAADVEGRLHVLDPTLGQPLGELGPFGSPVALASSAATETIALATSDKVLVWREGHCREIDLRARAIAFSRDGATLATADEKGTVRTFEVGGTSAPRETFSCSVKGTVHDITQHPNGWWVVAGSRGAFLVGASGSSRLDKVMDGVHRITLDAPGEKLVVQRSDNALVVYAWPALSVFMRIEYVDRPVRGIAFGPESWLGVALDHGDANKIDILTAKTTRTDTHPGREHRSWSLLVEGRSKTPIDDATSPPRARPEKTASSFNPRLGIGGLIAIALFSVRVCTRLGTNNTSSSYTNYGSPAFQPQPLSQCDKACAESRLTQLQLACGSAECTAEVKEVREKFAEGRCADTKKALANITPPSALGGGKDALFGSFRILAETGVEEACKSGAITARPKTKHAKLVHLVGSELTPVVEGIPETSGEAGEEPRSVWAAPDGTVFVATASHDTGAGQSVFVYRRRAGEWESIHEGVRAGALATLFGRSTSDLYLSTTLTLDHFDGSEWRPAAPTEIVGPLYLSGTNSDVFIARNELTGGGKIFRVRGQGKEAPIKETLSPTIAVTGLFGGPTSIWATGVDVSSGPQILQRLPGGAWTSKSPPRADDSPFAASAAWVSPTGEAFFSTGTRVLRSSGGAWTTIPSSASFHAMWGRSSSDIYGASTSGLYHYDGKRWSATSYSGKVAALGGTAAEVLVVRAD